MAEVAKTQGVPADYGKMPEGYDFSTKGYFYFY